MLPKRCCVVDQGQRLMLFSTQNGDGEEERDSSFGLVLKKKDVKVKFWFGILSGTCAPTLTWSHHYFLYLLYK